MQFPRRFGIDWERAGRVGGIFWNQGWITAANDYELPVGSVVGDILTKGRYVAE